MQSGVISFIGEMIQRLSLVEHKTTHVQIKEFMNMLVNRYRRINFWMAILKIYNNIASCFLSENIQPIVLKSVFFTTGNKRWF
ncbi:hypothetical protein HYN51_12790 [Limnobaculum parvum]|uniref:Uncharacterized protein n=1 Tax=Limnobaculum parvum TaxID=2172103 RepID=A0A2Y9U050_9GAMM|nr:hypothetical protein HYN51_12790 [Limnobaculum parvum]